MNKKIIAIENLHLLLLSITDLLTSIIMMYSFIMLFQTVFSAEVLCAISILIYGSVNVVPLLVEYKRWNTPDIWEQVNWVDGNFKVNINYSGLNPEQEARYQQLITSALSDWNSCKNINMQLTDDVSEAQIRIYFEYSPDNYWAGLTEDCGYILSLPVTLNTYYLNCYSDNMTKATIEHELGHAMGLDHSLGSHSVMYPITNNVTVTGADIAKLDSLFAC